MSRERVVSTEFGIKSPRHLVFYAKTIPPGALPRQCASMHPKPTPLGVNRVPEILRAKALIALSGSFGAKFRIFSFNVVDNGIYLRYFTLR